MLKCPCQRCCLVKYKCRVDIEGDLMCHGFLYTYTNWFLHGEDIEAHSEAVSVDHQESVDQIDSSTMNLLAKIFPSMDTDRASSSMDTEPQMDPPNEIPDGSSSPSMDTEPQMDPPNEIPDGSSSPSMDTDPLKQKKAFDELMSDCNQALYEGSFQHAKFPESFSDMKKTIHKLGLTYETIHACPNDCMLYWGEDSAKEKCKVCESSRWKTSEVVDDEESGKKKKKRKKKQAVKILRYFPLKPRLQRLFMSSHTADHMRWHADSESKDGKLRHPRDGLAWKTFNQQFHEFASESRNVRLGLATDGFNPFGTMSLSYSVWPVILVPYNLPPWMSMKQTSMILSMIISGKHMPGNDIDVYL
ncbi:unnamed protein product [Microthlaspi erraticum]|uniref:Transposase-associated domain-containing protein n=1 Tax=Microthlaspi erraticum TaxID=1685480 RepID=A0A6D2ICC5_9BRAS|nr:unnamed protein product [Microthlaspi erraticum]